MLLSPFRVILLVVNALCFGACLVFLALGEGDVTLVLLAVGTGLALAGGLAGAYVACRVGAKQKPPARGGRRS